MNSENSALTALSELKNLEADRIAQAEAERQQQAAAAQAAREAAERQAREEAERVAREEAERLAREEAEREAREREERIRVAEAEARSRAEQEARLAEEQMRIDAQMKLAERKARPKWPLLVIPVLVLGLGGLGFMWWSDKQDAAEQAAKDKAENDRLAVEARKQQELLTQITADLQKLKEEQDKLEKDRAELDNKLNAAQSEAERVKLLAEKQALETKIAQNEEAQQSKSSQKRKRRGSGGSGASSKKASSKPKDDTPAPATKVRKKKINLGDGDDPLSGL